MISEDRRMDPEDRRAVYQREYESFMYQDKLRWSRYQTVSVIEGAFLYAAYKGSLNPWESFIVALFGSLLVWMICGMALKDENDAWSHLNRIKIIEKEFGAPEFKIRNLLGFIKGRHLMRATVILVSVFNLAVLFDRIIKIVRN